MSGPTASILIPTKNAGAIIGSVLDAVVAQKSPFPFEIIVVDSGSTDNTLEVVAGYPQVKLFTIRPEEFGHGRTRNLAARSSDGDFLVFITHDAIPVDSQWLDHLVSPLLNNAAVAGAFGRHVAHADADPFVQRDLERHFAGFLHHPLLLSKDTDPDRYAGDPGWRSLLHFFSNNNSVLRRTVWEKHPFPDVEFAEDQIWANTIIESGYSKLYVPDATVAHSHSYGPMSQLRRAFDEAAAFRVLFGYRLAPSPVAAARTAVGLSLRDIRFGWDNKVGFFRTAKRMAQNIALATGHLLGTHAESLPNSVKQALSHDRRLLKNLRDAQQH